jgi:hypothetical protein
VIEYGADTSPRYFTDFASPDFIPLDDDEIIALGRLLTHGKR